MVYSFYNQDDIRGIKIHDCAFYGFEYRQKESEVEVRCKDEMAQEDIVIVFRNVIGIHMQSCRFWAGGNQIQCMYVADDSYISELQSKQNQNPELYSESRLAEGKRFIPVGMEINSGDELVICCEEFEILRKMNDALPDVNGIR